VKSAIVEQTNILSGQLAIMTDLLRTGGGGIAAGSGGAGLSEPNFSSPLEFAVNGRMGQSIA